MTPRAGRHVDEVIAVKGSLAIVTLIAIVRRSDVVLLSGDIRDLSALPTLPDVVTLVAVLARMRGVGEYRLENIARLRRAAIWPDRMTDATRADLALRGVAAEAIVMRRKCGRNVTSSTSEIVTRDASLRRPRVAPFMDCVIELHVKALDERCGERLHRRRICLHVLVADRTHRLRLGVGELT